MADLLAARMSGAEEGGGRRPRPRPVRRPAAAWLEPRPVRPAADRRHARDPRAGARPAARRRATSGLNPEDRPLTTDELHAAVAGADAVVTLLHDRVDDALPRRRRAAAARRRERRRRLRQRRRRRLRRRGVRVTNTPGRADRRDRRPRLRADPDGDPPAGRGRAADPRAASPGLAHVLHARHRDPGQDPRDRRPRAASGAATARRARAFGMEIVYSGRRRARPGARGGARRRRVPSTSCSRTADVVSLHCPLTRRDAPPDRRATRLRLMKPTAYLVNTDARARRRRGGARRGAARRRDRRRGTRRLRARAEVHPDLLELDNVGAGPAPRLGHRRDPHRDGACSPPATRSPCCAARSHRPRWPERAPVLLTDADGAPVTGEHAHVIRFDADALPPVARALRRSRCTTPRAIRSRTTRTGRDRRS